MDIVSELTNLKEKANYDSNSPNDLYQVSHI